MGRNEKLNSLYYFDAILHSKMTPDEREKEIERLKEESDKLTEWPET